MFITKKQKQKLALMVIHDNERLDGLQHIVNNLIERMADAGDDFEGRANQMRHSAEQTQAALARAEVHREELRQLFGLK